MTKLAAGVHEAVRRSWALPLIGAVVAAALATLVWLQVNHFQELQQSAGSEDAYLQVSLGQIETEHLRLQLQWQEAILRPAPDRAALKLRLDIFASRSDMLNSSRARRMFNDGADYRELRRALSEFNGQADALLSAPATARETAEQGLRELWPQLSALAPPIRSLLLQGAHAVATQITERNAAIADTNRTTLAVSLVLALAAFGLAVLSLAQFKRLEQRRHALQALADHLGEAQFAAEAASTAKNVFLANMSHEIRTPLQGVLGMLALMVDSPLDERQRRQLGTARDSADHLLAILNDILDLAKLESGKLETNLRAVALRELLSDVEALIRLQAQAKGLQLSFEVATDVPAWLELDPTRVRQILLNLCSNAVKFTARGQVTLRASYAGAQLQLAVHDTGIGIDAATMLQLFQRFARGDESRARRYGGTGLGLEISREIARLMGGEVDVTSTAGVGSTFVLTLPAKPAAPPAAAAGAVPTAAPGRRLKVLIVDDNEVNREYTSAVIENLGHFAVTAQDGGEAVAQVTLHSFDLVLMDLHMPGVDGLEATRAIRALPGEVARVPVVALTADAFDDTRAICLAAGMNDFTTKPVSPATLGAVLARCVRPTLASAPSLGQGAAASILGADALLDETHLAGVMRTLPVDVLARLVGKLRDDVQTALVAMQAACMAGRHEDLGRQAHSVKGMVGSLGLSALATSAAAVQAAAVKRDTAAAQAALQTMLTLLQPSQHALLQRLNSAA